MEMINLAKTETAILELRDVASMNIDAFYVWRDTLRTVRPYSSKGRCVYLASQLARFRRLAAEAKADAARLEAALKYGIV